MSFENDLKRGEVGEGIVLSRMLADHRTQGVFDVRKIKKYQDQDIDFIWGTWDGVYGVEVKYQMAYKNIFYETESFEKKGCMARSRAKFFAIYLPNINGRILMVNAEHIKAFISQRNYKEIQIDDGESRGKGYSIPIQELIDNGVASYVWEVN